MSASTSRPGTGLDAIRKRHREKDSNRAVAVHEGCYALVTHDRDFRGLTDLLVLGVDTSV